MVVFVTTMIGNDYKDPLPSPEKWHIGPRWQVSKSETVDLRSDPNIKDLSMDVMGKRSWLCPRDACYTPRYHFCFPGRKVQKEETKLYRES